MISILMPVYNVEKYIENTLQSIQKQTYEDFEVIMVDDGSTDKSGEIADAWAKEDKRFRVIHTENRGVSAARNTALSEVKGDYIFFMDSDDIILPETLEEMYNELIHNEADIISGNLFYTDENNKPLNKINKKSPVEYEALTNIEYLDKLCGKNANYYCTSTNKLFKKELFNNITYPVGKINEDEARIHEIIFKAKKIITLKKRYYNYIKHPQSITGSKITPKNLAREEAFRDRVEFFQSKGLDELAEKTALVLLKSAIPKIQKLTANGYMTDEIQAIIREHFIFCYPLAKRLKKKSFSQRKLLLVSWIVANYDGVYEKYVKIKCKLFK